MNIVQDDILLIGCCFVRWYSDRGYGVGDCITKVDSMTKQDSSEKGVPGILLRPLAHLWQVQKHAQSNIFPLLRTPDSAHCMAPNSCNPKACLFHPGPAPGPHMNLNSLIPSSFQLLEHFFRQMDSYHIQAETKFRFSSGLQSHPGQKRLLPGHILEYFAHPVCFPICELAVRDWPVGPPLATPRISSCAFTYSSRQPRFLQYIFPPVVNTKMTNLCQLPGVHTMPCFAAAHACYA